MPPETLPPRFVPEEGTVPSPGISNQVSAETRKERHDRAWSNLIFRIRYVAVVGLTLAAGAIALAALAILGWLVVIFLIHYTVPKHGWLSPSELGQLTGVYRNFAAFAVPAMLISNAWLVAYFGSRWFRSNNG